MDIEANLREYLYGIGRTQGVMPTERYASFDYCFNYFQSFREQGRLEALANVEHLQTSCLQLGFYLASWGMLRGSAFLLGKSVKFYERLVVTIVGTAPDLWAIDVDTYTPNNIKLILECKRQFVESLGRANSPSDTLVSKIMLGVFGNVPAFDLNFKTGFGVSTFGKQALEKVANFYETHKAVVDKYRVPTLDFATGQSTHRQYTRAKVVDMVFFIQGGKKSSDLAT